MKIFIVAAKRTPIGKFLGAFTHIPAAELGSVAAREIAEQLPKESISDVIVGNVLQAGTGMNIGRQIALKIELPDTVPDRQSTEFVAAVCRQSLRQHSA
jgi:acetyl-CoA C-acetyltransferase